LADVQTSPGWRAFWLLPVSPWSDELPQIPMSADYQSTIQAAGQDTIVRIDIEADREDVDASAVGIRTTRLEPSLVIS